MSAKNFGCVVTFLGDWVRDSAGGSAGGTDLGQSWGPS